MNANVVRADTVLARLFSKQPPQSDGGHTSLSGNGSVVPPSSQSHRTHLPLHTAPMVLPKNIDAGRPVEAATWHPGSSNANDVQELHVEQAVLPISPPPIQQRQVQPDRFDPESPPPPPPKDPRRSLHRRELAYFQSSLAQTDAASTAMMPVVPAPDLVSAPERIVTPHRGEQLQYVRPVVDVREPQTPTTVPHRNLPTPRMNAAAFSGDRASSPRSRTSMGVAVPTYKFSPEPTRSPRSKGSPRKGGGLSPLPLRSPFRSNYSTLYSLPDARSPPTAPRADQTLSRHRDS